MLKIEIETETVPMQTGLEAQMETQKKSKVEKETSFKKIHYALFIFVFYSSSLVFAFFRTVVWFFLGGSRYYLTSLTIT